MVVGGTSSIPEAYAGGFLTRLTRLTGLTFGRTSAQAAGREEATPDDHEELQRMMLASRREGEEATPTTTENYRV